MSSTTSGTTPRRREAARAYDRKALLFMGPSAITNFPATDYNGINLEADGSVEDQVHFLLQGPAVSGCRMGMPSAQICPAFLHGQGSAHGPHTPQQYMGAHSQDC